ncbi:MAG: PD-(D/E)XK nuclease family transposase [Chitinophagaceae bacterium]|nr:PD-(D/E)XK nuclease family transposase [Chitinophagaceae bacterium]
MNKRNQLPPKPVIGTFIDPLSDFGFKFLLGSEPTKELLIDFLNELFKGKKVIADIVYNRNEHGGPVPQSRRMVFDLTCTGQNGEVFIIEVQRIRQQYFKDRAVYYCSRLIHDQAPKGKEWDYSLKEVYFIGVMDAVLEDSDPAQCVHYVRMSYARTGREFYKKLGFIFIEIPKFAKAEKELKTGVDKWLFVLKNMSRLKKVPVMLNTRIFTKLFNIAAVSNLTKEQYMKYEKDLMASWDEYAIRKTLLEEGIERKNHEFVENLLMNTDFNVRKIAALVNVTEAFVKMVRAGMRKKK